MDNEGVIGLLAEILDRTYREWRVNGEYVKPTEEMIEFMLKTGSDIEPGEIFESGGLIIQNNGGHLDVYVHVGTLDNDSED